MFLGSMSYLALSNPVAVNLSAIPSTKNSSNHLHLIFTLQHLPLDVAPVAANPTLRYLIPSSTSIPVNVSLSAGEARREGSAEDAADAEPETDSKDAPDKDNK